MKKSRIGARNHDFVGKDIAMQPIDPRRLIVGFGYLGHAVADFWRQGNPQRLDSVSIWGTTRKLERFGALESRGVKPVQFDVLAPADSLPAVDFALYCVGFDRSIGVSMRSVYVDGVRGTLNRVPVPRRLVYISSTGVYGDFAGGWVDESTAADPGDVAGAVCLEAEAVVRSIAAQRGFELVILRLAGIYGPGRMIGIDAIRAGLPIAADPDSRLNLIHVDDASRVVEAARTHPHPRELYLVSDGAPVVRRDFYAHTAERLGLPPPAFESSSSRRSRGDRRISNRLMMEDLAPDLAYPDFRMGLRHCLEHQP